MGYTGFSHILSNQKQACALNTLFHALQYARQEAIHQHQIYHVGCLTKRCLPTWHNGLGIYSKSANNQETCRQTHPINSTKTLLSNQPCGFKFMPDGRCTTPGTLTLLAENGQKSQIIISHSGRIRIKLAE